MFMQVRALFGLPRLAGPLALCGGRRTSLAADPWAPDSWRGGWQPWALRGAVEDPEHRAATMAR